MELNKPFTWGKKKRKNGLQAFFFLFITLYELNLGERNSKRQHIEKQRKHCSTK